MNPNYGVIIVVVVIVEIMQENAPEKLISEVKKQVCFESIPSFARQMYKFILKTKTFLRKIVFLFRTVLKKCN